MPDLPSLEVILNSSDSRQWEELMLRQEEETEYRAGFRRHDPVVEIPEKVDREEEASLGRALFAADREREYKEKQAADKRWKISYERELAKLTNPVQQKPTD